MSSRAPRKRASLYAFTMALTPTAPNTPTAARPALGFACWMPSPTYLRKRLWAGCLIPTSSLTLSIGLRPSRPISTLRREPASFSTRLGSMAPASARREMHSLAVVTDHRLTEKSLSVQPELLRRPLHVPGLDVRRGPGSGFAGHGLAHRPQVLGGLGLRLPLDAGYSAPPPPGQPWLDQGHLTKIQ